MARGPVAEDIADLTWFLSALGGVVYVLVLVLFAVPVIRRRRRGGDDADARAAVPAAIANRSIVLGGVVLPVVVLPVVLAVSVMVMRDLPLSATADDALVVEVVGRQWWWEIRYPDGFATANEIRIPVGRPVELRLTSADVIHSFWVPELAGKIDALPDGVNTLVIEASSPGEYRGACAEFCGLQHAEHQLLVVAETPAAFDAWLARQRRPAVAPGDRIALAGQELYRRAQCGTCHTIRGTGAAGVKGPDLTHFALRRTLTAGLLPHTRHNLARWIRDPASLKEGTKMPPPPIALDDDELDALLAYLESLE